MDGFKAPTPKVKSFLICDQVIQGTDGKHSVIGVFQRIHATEFPVFHHRFGMYLMFGEMRGQYILTIRFVDPEDEKILAEAKLEGIDHNRPLEDFETGVNLPGLEIPHSGVFEVRLFCNDELVHVDTIRAVQVEGPEGSSDEEGEEFDGDTPGGFGGNPFGG